MATTQHISSIHGDFSLEETRALEDNSIFLHSATRGKRIVSGALLTPPASQGPGSSSSLSSAPGLSYASTSVHHKCFSSSSDYTLDLPESAVSVAALEFIGFTTETATEIFIRFASRPDPDQCPDDLLGYARGHAQMLSENPYRDYPPTQAMTQIGLSQQFQDAITDPHFSTIFETETLLFWIKDTLHINYLTLVQLQRRLIDHANRIIAKKAKRDNIEVVVQPAASLSSNQIPLTATLNMTSEDHNLPKDYVTVQNASPVLQDHYVLYKAKAAAEMGEPQCIQDDGSLLIYAITRYSGGDFNYASAALYLTPEAETAEAYRAWTARRCPYSDTWVIRIQIPMTFIHCLRQQDLWYSKNWKEYVWYCRKEMKPPAKYKSYWYSGGADLIKGHICTGVQDLVTRIKKKEVQTEVSEENVLRTGSIKATQWVFMHYNTIERLEEEIRGNIHIEITAAEHVQKKYRTGRWRDS